MNTGRGRPDRLTGAALMVAGLVAAAVVAGVVLAALGSGGSDDGAGTDPAELGSSDGDGAEGDDGGDTGAVEQAGAGDDEPAPAGPTTTVGSATTVEITTETVEADETTEDPTDGDNEDDHPGAGTDGADGRDPGDRPDDDGGEGDTGGADDTVPTVPPVTTGTCRIAVGDLDGQAGVVELGTGGVCAALSATIQAVDPRDGLTATNWGRDIRVCQRHPAAGEVGVTVSTSSQTIELTQGLSRTATEAGTDPIEAITIRFDDQDSPVTGPRPVAMCRTDGAEVSIVHRPIT